MGRLWDANRGFMNDLVGLGFDIGIFSHRFGGGDGLRRRFLVITFNWHPDFWWERLSTVNKLPLRG